MSQKLFFLTLVLAGASVAQAAPVTLSMGTNETAEAFFKALADDGVASTTEGNAEVKSATKVSCLQMAREFDDAPSVTIFQCSLSAQKGILLTGEKAARLYRLLVSVGVEENMSRMMKTVAAREITVSLTQVEGVESALFDVYAGAVEADTL